MTTVAAIMMGGRVAVGSDGACIWGGSVTTRRAQKIVFWDNGVIVGASGEGRVVQVLRKIRGAPLDPEELWDAIKVALKEDGFVFGLADGAAQGAPNCGCSFIFAIEDRLWEVDGSGGIRAFPEGRAAVIGSGGAEACGALDAVDELRPGMRADDAVHLAVDIGKARDQSSGGDTYVVGRAYGDTEVKGGWVESTSSRWR